MIFYDLAFSLSCQATSLKTEKKLPKSAASFYHSISSFPNILFA